MVAYVFSTCPGNVDFDTELTIYDSNWTYLVENDDGCQSRGFQSEVTLFPFVSHLPIIQSDSIYLLVDQWPCASNTIDTTIWVTAIYPPPSS